MIRHHLKEGPTIDCRPTNRRCLCVRMMGGGGGGQRSAVDTSSVGYSLLNDLSHPGYKYNL